jgi:flagella basal body P-ring formation protein FlgA
MKFTKTMIAATAVCVSGVLAITAANAAELRLRADAHSQGNVVRLQDVADILGAEASEAQSLGQIELVPAPAAGKQRPISIREIQDTLERRGVNMLQCHFTGASQVVVSGSSDSTSRAGKPKLLPASSMQEAQHAVAAAITEYLQRSTSADQDWNVDVDLTDAQAQVVLTDVHHVEARGGRPPWAGPQKFDIQVRNEIGPAQFTVAAKVSVPAAVVVTLRDVSKGSIIQAADVELERLKPGVDIGDSFQSLDDVVGREAILSITPGQVLDPQYVHAQILVKRGSVVTVFVQAPGIKIRTTGRVKDDGGRGEQVTVESLLDRKTFLAKVTGIDQVELSANTETMPTETSAPAPVAKVSSRPPLTKVRLNTRPISAEIPANIDNSGNR